MDWSKRKQASVATWGVLAHHEVGQINPRIRPYDTAAEFSLAMLTFYDPGASGDVKRHKAYGLSGKFVAYVVHFYKPWLEAGHSSPADYQKKLDGFVDELTDLLAAPEGKTLTDMAKAVDQFFRFADEK